MSEEPGLAEPADWYRRLTRLVPRGTIPAGALTVLLACVIGVLAGYGSVIFTLLIGFVTDWTLRPVLRSASEHPAWLTALVFVPAAGLIAVSWFTRRFAPEAEGHGVPEVIAAVARHDGMIRPRVAVVKTLASGLCIGTGGSIGREGPIVQIGSSLGSMAGQFFKLSARNIKVLVAAGAAAGISATFHAPLAGAMFASEIILGHIAVESLAPIVVASVLADVVQVQVSERGWDPAFPELFYTYHGDWGELPSYVLLGLMCGLAAVGFTKLLYTVEDVSQRRLQPWWLRALVCGGLVGAIGVTFMGGPPVAAEGYEAEERKRNPAVPALFGVGYETVDHALHMENAAKTDSVQRFTENGGRDKLVILNESTMPAMLLWLLPLAFLKPLLTSLTLGGGGSGGIFAPSLFLGASLGGSFGIGCNLLFPEWSANPGVYAIVGMGAVVAGTTHGMLSAILIVYEMTGDYRIILPIMAAAGLASLVAGVIDADSIYTKKLSRQGIALARGQHVYGLEHIRVGDVMVRDFPTVQAMDTVPEIVRIARANPHVESLPVLNDEGRRVGIIRPEDLHRVLDSDVSPQLLNAEDIALPAPLAVSPDQNLLEALRDFGTRDIDTLPVEEGDGDSRKLVGLLMRADVMRRYREEMLRSSSGNGGT